MLCSWGGHTAATLLPGVLIQQLRPAFLPLRSPEADLQFVAISVAAAEPLKAGKASLTHKSFLNKKLTS